MPLIRAYVCRGSGFEALSVYLSIYTYIYREREREKEFRVYFGWEFYIGFRGYIRCRVYCRSADVSTRSDNPSRTLKLLPVNSSNPEPSRP